MHAHAGRGTNQVVGDAADDDGAARPDRPQRVRLPPWQPQGAPQPVDRLTITDAWKCLQRLYGYSGEIPRYLYGCVCVCVCVCTCVCVFVCVCMHLLYIYI